MSSNLVLWQIFLYLVYDWRNPQKILAVRPVLTSNRICYFQVRRYNRIGRDFGRKGRSKGRVVTQYIQPAVHDAIGYRQKSFMLVWQYRPLMSRFLVKDHLPWVSRQIRLSDYRGNEVSSSSVKNLLTFKLQLTKHRKTSVWRLCYQTSPQMGYLVSKWRA